MAIKSELLRLLKVLIRDEEIKIKVFNAKALSERIGMNQSLLAQYIKCIK